MDGGFWGNVCHIRIDQHRFDSITDTCLKAFLIFFTAFPSFVVLT